MSTPPAYVLDTTRSPLARLLPVPLPAVTLTDGFWQPRLARNRQQAIPRLFDLLASHGVLDNFRRLSGAHTGPRRGYLFTDSDLYKWMEAAAYSLLSPEAAQVQPLLEQAMAAVLPAQQEDGYLNTWFVDERAGQRWTDLAHAHELYCAGHFIQAAIAHQRATGESPLLAAARRLADHIDQVFRLGGRPGAPGHPEIEMALVELHRATGQTAYLRLAEHFLRQGGAIERRALSGHAVRALYSAAGSTDLYLESGDPAHLAALRDQWQDLTRRKAYVTGGVGSRFEGEAVGAAYELPNERAYAETCAAAGAIFWHWRMLQVEGAVEYADWLERTLYNGFLAGVSLTGTEYFYRNPLSSSGSAETDPWYTWANRPAPQRQPWYDCTCCPPNVQRLLASLPAYMVSVDRDQGIWVHLYAAGEVNWQLADGAPFRLTQTTRYPWDGHIQLDLAWERPTTATLHLRLPGWSPRVVARVDGELLPAARTGGYLTLARRWPAQATITLNLAMPALWLAADPRVINNAGRVAVQRGPLVYCLEGVDHTGADVRGAYLSAATRLMPRFEPELLGGVVVLEADGGGFYHYPQEAPLYAPLAARVRPERRSEPLRFIPYYAWGNRGAGSLAVWVGLDSQHDWGRVSAENNWLTVEIVLALGP